MENKKTIITKNYADLVEHTISTLHLSYSEIKMKYANYPLCVSNYFENGVENKFIEIRFDKDEASITCTFDDAENCDFVYLFLDSNEIARGLILYLKCHHLL